MTTAFDMLGALTLAAAPSAASEPMHIDIQQGDSLLLLLLALPALAAILNAVYRALGVRNKLPAWTSVALLGASFLVALKAYLDVAPQGLTQVVHGFEWINLRWGAADGQSLRANFALWVDSLTALWMLFVTGLATLIALYASEYMEHDVKNGHYPRFFSAFCLFVFAMTCLVMGDNLLMLFLGWEGVGLCSYLLIGYHYQRPSAVAAAKKAFVVNRIGDLGLLVAMMVTFVHFGSLEYAVIFSKTSELQAGVLAGAAVPAAVAAIPFLLALAAFGKSAQLPLFVWLPDAMEGPTPVSALIHAATMVTAGVYLVARTLPLFALTPDSLTLIAWVGGLTALVSATIAMAVFDIKRVMAYSTVSQLGYMFLGLGVLAQAGAAYHVFTHAFFKATLFLSCGAVMHAFAGQLDLRKLSGLMKLPGWKITGAALLVGCLCLAGFPFTSGFFSKDMIIAEAFVTRGPGFVALGVLALVTAGLTAYYAFRVFFRVFMGPLEYEPGDDHHAHDHDADHDHAHAAHDFHPHAPKWAINAVLLVLLVGSLAAAIPYFMGDYGWVTGLVQQSTASSAVLPADGAVHLAGDEAHPSFFGLGDPHKLMYFVSGAIAVLGIFIAWALHLRGRTTAATSAADAVKQRLGFIGRAAENKWYFDEVYDWLLRRPLYVLGYAFAAIDKIIIDQLVNAFGALPHVFARVVRPSQSGVLQGYALGMAGGLVAILLIVWITMSGALGRLVALVGAAMDAGGAS